MQQEFTYKGRPYSFAQVQQHWQRNRATLMAEMGQVAVNFFKDRFRAQAWTDKTAQRWAKRSIKNRYQRRGMTGKNSSRLKLSRAGQSDQGRAILIQTGKLRNSIHVKRSTINIVTVGTSVGYAAVHNFGYRGSVTVKPHSRKVRGRVSLSNIETRRASTKKVVTGSTRVKGYTRRVNIPQRQFMGESQVLINKFDRIILRNVDKSFEL